MSIAIVVRLANFIKTYQLQRKPVNLALRRARCRRRKGVLQTKLTDSPPRLLTFKVNLAVQKQMESAGRIYGQLRE